MFIKYTPEGQETQTYEFKPGQVRLSEQARIERDYARLAGERKSFQSIAQDLREGSAVPLRLALHLCLRRQHPTVRLDDVDPMGDEVEILYHKAELEELRDSIEATPGMPNRDVLLARLAVDIKHAPDADPDEEPGKASGSSSSETGNSAAVPSPRRGRRTK